MTPEEPKQDPAEEHRPKPSKQGSRPEEIPAAGPHARPDLVNPDATPGAGTMPAPGSGRDSDPGAG